MTAPVRIEAEAFADPRIDLLGTLAGYNRYEALGRLAHLWRFCTERSSYVVSEAVVSATLGDRGVQAIIEAELGDRVPDGIRVRGTEGRIEWLEKKRAAAAAGGEANRRRLKAQPGASQSDSHMATHTGASRQPEASGPKPAASPLSLDLVPDLSASHTHAPAIPPPAVAGYDSTNRNHVDAWVAWTFRAISDARVAVAAEFKISNALPFPMRQNTPSESRGCRDLRARIREEGDNAPRVCTQVVEALAAEGRATKSVDWLSEKAFTEGGWRHAREAVDSPPSRERAGPHATPRAARGAIGASTPHTNYGNDSKPAREVL